MKIYQQFVLDEFWVASRKMMTSLPASFNPDNARVLITNLQAQGYEVLTGAETLNGMPTDIILGGEDSQDHKAAFGTVSRSLGLQFFKSGKYYRKK